MKKIIDFILQNKELIITCISFLTTTTAAFILFIKSRDKSEKFQVLYSYVEQAIKLAEGMFPNGHGEVKKDIVMRSTKEFAKSNKIEITDDDLSVFIENLLSLPEKK